MELTTEQLAALARSGASNRELVSAMGRKLTPAEVALVDRVHVIARLQKATKAQAPDKAQSRFVDRGADRALVPKTCENPARKARYERDAARWLRYYLRESFPLPFSPIHLEIITSAIYQVAHGGNMVVICPRGFGKTAVLCGVMLLSVLTGKLRFPAIITATGPDSKKILKLVLNWLCYNERLMADYPEWVQPFNAARGSSQRIASATWSTTGQVTGAGVQLGDGCVTLPDGLGFFGCRSITGAVKGLFSVAPDGAIIRPDLALLDDPQTRESATSATQTLTRIDTIDGDVAGMAGPNRAMSIFMANTFVCNGDLADHYAQDENYEHKTFSLIDGMPARDSDQMALWEEYNEARLEGNAKKDKGMAARKFYRVNREALTTGWTVAWRHCVKKERNEVDAEHNAINEYFMLGRAAFMAEKQGTPESSVSASLYEITPGAVLGNLNGLNQREAHPAGQYLTIGIDVNWDHWGLSWVVLHSQTDMGGHAIDYGVYTGGGAALWEKGMAVTPEEAIYQGILALVKQLVLRYNDSHGIDCVTVDGNKWTTTIHRAVAQLNRTLPCRIIVNRGRSWKHYKKPTRAHGFIRGRDECHRESGKHGAEIVFNSSCWHMRQQMAWLQAPGAKASLSLWGADPVPHRLFATHVCAEKLMAMVEHPDTGITEYVWQHTVGEKNDIGDALVMAMVAANIEGADYGQAENDIEAEAAEGGTKEPAIVFVHSRRKR